MESTGTIARVRHDKQFGFIQGDGEAREYFFHRADLRPPLVFDTLHVGARVTFQPKVSDKGNGLRASNVGPAV